MIKTYKNLAIFKRTPKPEDSPNSPAYDMVASYKNPDGSFEKGINVGGVWLKEGAKGKYFSVTLKKIYELQRGYVLVDEQELNDLITAYNKLVLGDTVQEELPEDPNEIPF